MSEIAETTARGVCLRVHEGGYGWEQAYEIETTRRQWPASSYTRPTGQGSLPASAPTCLNCRRQRGAHHARPARLHPHSSGSGTTNRQACPVRQQGECLKPEHHWHLSDLRTPSTASDQRRAPFVDRAHAAPPSPARRPTTALNDGLRPAPSCAPPLPEPLAVSVADSHTHLDMQDGTVEEALDRAASVGVTTVVQVGCDVKGSQWAADTAEAYDNVHAAVALHPNEAPRIVHGDPDGWSRQDAREPRRRPAALDEALAEIERLAALAAGAGPSARPASTTSAPAPRAWPPRSAPSGRTSRSPSGRARRSSSTIARRTPMCCASSPRKAPRNGPSSTVIRATRKWPNSAPQPATSCPSRET